LLRVVLKNPTKVDCNIFHAVFNLAMDEDVDVREPLQELIGDITNSENILGLILDSVTAENKEEYIRMLLDVGVLNDERKLKLFDIEERETAFEMLNLNQNHEPVHLTKISLNGIGKILEKVHFLSI
jgi:hypothetical protein